MNSENLSQRLKVVADYVEKGARLADIGSDHAYLPCYLADRNLIEYAVAGEVVQGPFKNALKEVNHRGLKDKVEVRLGDGLEVIKASDHIDTVVIAGMGGSLIRDILEKGQKNNRLTGMETLILQPNVFEETVREYLMINEYTIISEKIISENDKIYEIIKAVPADKPVSYSKKELFFGPFLMKEKSTVFIEKWQQQLKTYKFILKQVEQSKEPDQVKITRLKEAVVLIEEMIG